MLGGASKKVVMIEIKVYDRTVAIDGDARDIMSKVAIPINTGSLRVCDPVTMVALSLWRRLDEFDLLRSLRIVSERSVLVCRSRSDGSVSSKDSSRSDGAP